MRTTDRAMTSIRLLLLALLTVGGLGGGARAQVHPQLPVAFELAPLDDAVNSAGNDYAPFIGSAGEVLYFTSFRRDDGVGRADVLRAARRSDGRWEAARLVPELCSPHNDGSISMSSDATVVVVASDRPDGFGDTDLYIAHRNGTAIGPLRNFGAQVNSSYWETQPTLSPDGRTVVFASNRRSGVGNVDLWMSTRDRDGQWSAPVNLGASVNSSASEIAPSFSPDGATLFFASDRSGGAGGYDIYYSRLVDGEFGSPVWLGAQINSGADEMFFCVGGRDSSFYVATTRRGGRGGLDIWEGRPERTTPTEPLVHRSSADTPPPEPDPQTEMPHEVLASFDLGSYNIPFFVTGYYRPNTASELDRLVQRLDDDLKLATYIEQLRSGTVRHRSYQRWSQTVEAIFDSVRRVGCEQMFPAFERIADDDEVLEITVVGYADPRPFRGPYVEPEAIPYLDHDGRAHTVRMGDTIGNAELSGLRAWYAGNHLRNLLLRDTNCAAGRLVRDGRIRFRYIGGGVDSTEGQLSAQRRIHISIARSARTQ